MVFKLLLKYQIDGREYRWQRSRRRRVQDKSALWITWRRRRRRPFERNDRVLRKRRRRGDADGIKTDSHTHTHTHVHVHIRAYSRSAESA